MYSTVEYCYRPIEIMTKMETPYVEMSEKEHGFICGLIRDHRPQKVLEVGVAGGGTTAVIINCLNEFCPEAKMYSVDISEECYKREGKKTGFQLDAVRNYLPNIDNHKFLLGKELPCFIEQIGNGIDFLILDTVHVMPGEFLDFICALPFLKDGAIVVLHDVSEHCRVNNAYGYCTRLLLCSVTAEKYYNANETDDIRGFFNIAAFKIDQSTRDELENVISALSVTWRYIPPESMIDNYYAVYIKYYMDNQFSHICKIVERYRYIEEFAGERKELLKKLADYEYIYIYGAGYNGRKLQRYLKHKGYNVSGYVVSDDHYVLETEKYGEEIFRIADIENLEECICLISILDEGIKERLDNAGIKNIKLSAEFLRLEL